MGNGWWRRSPSWTGPAATGPHAATAGQRHAGGPCVHCGQSHAGRTRLRHPAAHAAPRVVRWYAYAGCAALGALALPGSALPWPVVVMVAGPAWVLLLGLVRPWGMVLPHASVRAAVPTVPTGSAAVATAPAGLAGLSGRRVPRRQLLAVAWVVAPVCALSGTVGLAAAGGGIMAFAVGAYGWALAVAALSYQRRTRPSCEPQRMPVTA